MHNINNDKCFVYRSSFRNGLRGFVNVTGHWNPANNQNDRRELKQTSAMRKHFSGFRGQFIPPRLWLLKLIYCKMLCLHFFLLLNISKAHVYLSVCGYKGLKRELPESFWRSMAHRRRASLTHFKDDSLPGAALEGCRSWMKQIDEDPGPVTDLQHRWCSSSNTSS